MDKKDIYIRALADNSPTRDHELLIDCMDYYRVYSLGELSLEQLKKFCILVGVEVNEREFIKLRTLRANGGRGCDLGDQGSKVSYRFNR